MGKRGNFFRTPKRGMNASTDMKYYMDLKMDRSDYIEAIFSAIGIVVGIIVLYYGVWILSLSLLIFSILTLKSVNFRKSAPADTPVEVKEISEEAVKAL